MSKWHEDTKGQVSVSSMTAFGIPISSRHGKARELAELLLFASACARDGVEGLVKDATYDSGDCCCRFVLDGAVTQGSVQEAFLLDAAMETIGQFEWFRTIHHGRGGQELE